MGKHILLPSKRGLPLHLCVYVHPVYHVVESAFTTWDVSSRNCKQVFSLFSRSTSLFMVILINILPPLWNSAWSSPWSLPSSLKFLLLKYQKARSHLSLLIPRLKLINYRTWLHPSERYTSYSLYHLQIPRSTRGPYPQEKKYPAYQTFWYFQKQIELPAVNMLLLLAIWISISISFGENNGLYILSSHLA